MGKSIAHTKYKTKDGDSIPGVTTILGVLNKPALVPWANKLGLQGIEVGKYVDNLADAGTLAHNIVECHLKNEKPDYSDYSKNQIDLAENAALKYFAWEKENKVEMILSEAMLVSEVFMFGGTIDCYANLNGKKTLIDFKTCKALYGEHFTQTAAYKVLLEEAGYQVEDIRILRIGRDESEGFEDAKVPMIDLHWEKFKHCLEIYRINKLLGK